jgi:hypothetical protein
VNNIAQENALAVYIFHSMTAKAAFEALESLPSVRIFYGRYSRFVGPLGE